MTATAEATDEQEVVATPRRRRIVTALVVLVLLAAATGVGVLHLRQAAAARLDSARSEAGRAAAQHIPEVLSYSHDTLDRDLDAAQRAVTGAFARDYLELQRSAVRPAAVRDRISTRTTVSALGVVSAEEDRVVVLAFINQLTTSARQTTPLIEGARVRVTLEKTGDDWLVSKMDTV